MIRQLEGKKVMQEIEQVFISYNNREDVLLGRAAVTARMHHRTAVAA